MGLHQYLFFTTQCEAALAFYAQCGIGEVESLVRYGDRGMPVVNEAMRGKVMHASFTGPGVSFFASDNDDAEPMRGFAMIFMLESRALTEDLFTKLSSGGTITTPLGLQTWGDTTAS